MFEHFEVELPITDMDETFSWMLPEDEEKCYLDNGKGKQLVCMQIFGNNNFDYSQKMHERGIARASEVLRRPPSFAEAGDEADEHQQQQEVMNQEQQQLLLSLNQQLASCTTEAEKKEVQQDPQNMAAIDLLAELTSKAGMGDNPPSASASGSQPQKQDGADGECLIVETPLPEARKPAKTAAAAAETSPQKRARRRAPEPLPQERA